jgi:hypothetical protein
VKRETHRKREFKIHLCRVGSGSGLSGFEAELFAPMPDDCDIDELLNRRWQSGGDMPINALIVVAQREAIELGAVQAGEPAHHRGRSLAWSNHLPVLVADPARMGAFEESFADIAEAMADFASQEPKLWSRLGKECGLALFRSRPRPAVSGGGGGG